MYHSFLIHSSADGHLGCFHVLAIINSAAINIGVHVYPSVHHFSFYRRFPSKPLLVETPVVIIHCVYVPQLSYPFICRWTSRLLPCPGYYKQCCDEHWGTRVSFPSGFLGVYAQKWDCWVIRQFYFVF